MCAGCVPLDYWEVGRITWEAGAALDSSTRCVHSTRCVLPSKAAPASQVILPTSQVSIGTHLEHIPTSQRKPPNLPAHLTGQPHSILGW